MNNDKIDFLRSVAAENAAQGLHLKCSTWKKPHRRHKATRQLITDEWKRLTSETTQDSLKRDNKTLLTYFNVEAPPSVYPTKKYCDITGLKANYKSPGNGLRFCNSEVYSLVIKPMAPGVDQEYLKLRGDNVVLK
ncbi:LAFA_0E01838g1_1 [Lachancea sp. 'fantastica']|nr:LAFA_0E01838g1_1 [Lachancea sp. 'fantastica']